MRPRSPSCRGAVMGSLAALLLAAPLPGLSQHPDTADSSVSVPAGSRVRAMPTGAERYHVGSLLAVPDDSVRLSLERTGDSLALARASLARFDVSRGRRAQTGKGAIYGLAVGAFAGLILGAATYEGCDGCFGPDPGIGGSAVIGGILFGAIGAGVGAIVGAQVKGERWVPVDPRPGAQEGK